MPIFRVCVMMALLMVFLPLPVWAAFDFVKNGEFREGLTGWTVERDDQETGGLPQVQWENGVVHFIGKLGGSRQGIRQKLDIDVSGYQSLILRAVVRVDQARLAGTGLQGTEAPVSLYVVYTDVNGMLHDRLDVPPADQRRMFWRGFYYLDPQISGGNVDGIKVRPGVWQEYQMDLMRLSPRPGIVHYIGAEGSGWAPRSGGIKDISLIAPEEGREFIANPTLSGLAAGWQVCVDFQPAAYQAELVPLARGIQIKSSIGDKRVGLMQKLDADVSAYRSLILSAEIKVDAQRLGGTGYNGKEAPLALFVTYTDVNGVLHGHLPDRPDAFDNRMFWRGLYCLLPEPPATGAHGLAVESGKWRTIEFELMELQPQPQVIHSVGVESSGRSPRDGSVRYLSLKGR